MKKLIFIVNPAAKNGASLKVWKKIRTLLDQVPYEVYFSQYKHHAKEMSAELAKTISEPIMMVAVGGDGTIHEVLNGVLPYQHITIAYIPAGSGNDFARGFRLPSNPIESVRHILKMIDAPGIRYDVGSYEVKDRSGYFVSSLGAGFDAVISKKANQSSFKKIFNKISLGQLIYVFYLFVELFRFQPVTIKLFIDGKKYIFEKTWFVTISNQSYFGGGMKISPMADPRDGELDITIVHKFSRWKILMVFVSVFWGGHLRFKEVITLKGQAISIQSEQAIPIHVDGEQAGMTPVSIKVNKNCWNCIQSYPNFNEQSA